ncbi:response regulator [Pseudomonas sp. DC3200b2]|uniref:response regulator n=1 Tax=Pseudomonas sp. DC3200b2 TaxID=2804669 RepID=UPI003CF19166
MTLPGAPWGDDRLHDLRVLVVEDDALVSMFVEALLDAVGVGEGVRLAHTLEQGQWLAESGNFDLALLDVYLDHQPVFGVARTLQARGVPFAFVSGNPGAEVQAQFPGVPVIHKPFQAAELEGVLRQLLAASFAQQHRV